jgi:hypothetical protein
MEVASAQHQAQDGKIFGRKPTVCGKLRIFHRFRVSSFSPHGDDHSPRGWVIGCLYQSWKTSGQLGQGESEIFDEKRF